MRNWRYLYYALAAGFGLSALLTPFSILRSLPVLGLGISVALAVYCASLGLYILQVKPASPLTALSDFARSSGATERLPLLVVACLFMMWLPPHKAMIPAYAGFWADAPLAALERSILGRDAFLIAHDLAPSWFLPLIDALYYTWFPITVATVGVVALKAREPGQFLLSWALCWTVLGVFAATALASAGPIFGTDLGHGFDYIPDKLDGTMAFYFKEQLWAFYARGELGPGAGISAAPSLHCAAAFITAFAAWHTRWRAASILYAATIWFGSVYLGWHYAIDGLLSLVGATAIWIVSGFLVRQADPPTQGMN